MYFQNIGDTYTFFVLRTSVAPTAFSKSPTIITRIAEEVIVQSRFKISRPSPVTLAFFFQPKHQVGVVLQHQTVTVAEAFADAESAWRASSG